jgi:transposase
MTVAASPLTPWSHDVEVHRLKILVNSHKRKMNFYKSMHKMAKLREKKLQLKIGELEAALRYERHQRFGNTGDESSPVRSEVVPIVKHGPQRKRGQQVGNPAPARRPLAGLPEREEKASVDSSLRTCSCCGEPLLEGILDDENSQVIEVEVKAHVRKIRKERLVRRCRCESGPRVVTGQAVGPLFGGSNLGVSVFVELLIGHFSEHLPMRRVLARLAGIGCQVPAGTIASIQPRLLELFQPIITAIVERNRLGSHWHADETSHRVFVTVPDKKNFTWWLWTFVAKDSTVYVMSPTRSHQVLVDHFGNEVKGVLSADRYSAYKAWVKLQITVLLAFCWAHVRRDFIKAATEWPNLIPWRDAWLRRIGELYHLNNIRVNGGPHEPVVVAVAAIQAARIAEQAQKDLHPAQRKVLDSLENHWSGLTIFVDNITIPMDNNTAEQALRMQVVARKSFNGCGSIPSANLLAGMATIFSTLAQHAVSPRAWLTEYLATCARGGGHPPVDIQPHLPWEISSSLRHGK